MRAVVQRVSRASVSVSGEEVATIDRGLLVLLGVAEGDGDADVKYMVDKLAGLRIFPDDLGRMNHSVTDIDADILVVSQFTVMGDVRRGKRPDFTGAAAPADGEALYLQVVGALTDEGIHCECGIFGAHMDVEMVNEGPVTVLLDSRKGF